MPNDLTHLLFYSCRLFLVMGWGLIKSHSLFHSDKYIYFQVKNRIVIY